MYKLLLLCLIIILLLLSYKYFYIKKEHFESENIDINIGNYLSAYFFNLGLCILQKKDFNYNIDKNINFIKYLPNNIKYDDKMNEINNNLIKNGITYNYISKQEDVALWFINDNKIINFWICLKDLIYEILDNALKKSNLYEDIKYPIIHFRCSDTPFVLHRQYHFAKYEFYKNALEKINEYSSNKKKKVILLSCNTHLSNDKVSCTKYSKLLSNYLNSIGYKTDIKCGSNIRDFATMFYSPGVISIGSSYSFMAGFFGNGIFISSEHIEEDQEKKGCSTCDDWMIEGKVKHKYIPDYYDFKTVNKILLE
jgi:hypothetical protein